MESTAKDFAHVTSMLKQILKKLDSYEKELLEMSAKALKGSRIVGVLVILALSIPSHHRAPIPDKKISEHQSKLCQPSVSVPQKRA